MANEYSKKWFEIYMNNKSALETEEEAGFIMRNLPLSKYRKILDLCCGQGRHANILAKNGYKVAGIDRDKDALELASRLNTNEVKYFHHDMRDIKSLNQSFDAIISMWHSFGYFENEVNIDIIRQISESLTADGRFILDIYNKSYYENNIGISEVTKGGISIISKVERVGAMFNTRLSYENKEESIEEFSWYLYTKDEIVDLCERFGLILKIGCTWCDEKQSITDKTVRMQFVFEKSN